MDWSELVAWIIVVNLLYIVYVSLRKTDMPRPALVALFFALCGLLVGIVGVLDDKGRG